MIRPADSLSAVAGSLRRLRWRIRRLLASVHYGSEALQRAPLLFGNSFPKSGTHLLTQVLDTFPHIGPAVVQGMGPVLTFDRRSGVRREASEIVHDLTPLGPGDISFGHVIATPETLAVLCGPRVAHYFLLRDPRDVAVSHAFYVSEMALDHVHHEYYSRKLASADERLRASILGRPELGEAFPDIQSRFALYQGWLDCPWVCVLRFEDFITDRRGTLNRMLDYAQERGLEMRLSRGRGLELLEAAIDPLRSPTFRAGKIGGWMGHFSPEHKKLFKDVAGELLIRLGYEHNHQW